AFGHCSSERRSRSRCWAAFGNSPATRAQVARSFQRHYFRSAHRHWGQPASSIGATRVARRGGSRNPMVSSAPRRTRGRAMNQIPALVRVFSYLSLLTVGGGMAAFPELKHLTVEVHHWLTFHQLIHLYSVGQMSPGPNMMMIVAIGQWVAGLPGAIVVLIAFFLPTALLALLIGRLWTRLDTWPWRTSSQRGLAPVAIGLLLAGTLTMGKGALTGWITTAVAVGVFVTLLRTRVNPALLVLVGAVVGLLALR